MLNKEGGSMSPTEHKSMTDRDDKEESDYSMLDAIAEDMMSAFKSGNVRMLKEALASYKEHIAEEDEVKDEKQFMKKEG